jgi:hypothetical protein
MTLVEILQGTNVALRLLQAKLILVLALVLTAGGFAWSMYLQTQLSAIIAAAFAVLVFLPILWSTGERYGKQAQHQPAEDTEPLPARGNERLKGDGASRVQVEQRSHS